MMTFGKQTHAFKTIYVLDILLITLLNFSYVYELTFSNLQVPSELPWCSYLPESHPRL